MNYINQLIICALISLSSFQLCGPVPPQPQQQNPNAGFGALVGALGNVLQQQQKITSRQSDSQDKYNQEAL